MRRSPWLVVGLLVVACGGAGNATGAPTVAQATAPPASPSPAPIATATRVPTEAPTVAPSAAATGGVVIDGYFRDPEGVYELRVDPDWIYQAGGFAQGIEFWFLGPPEDEFTPNLNLLTQSTGGMTLTDYIEASIDSGPALIQDFELVASDEFDGESGTLGLLEFTGMTSGRKLHFLTIMSVGPADAVVATLTAPVESFDDRRDEVEPFMLTLRRP